MKRIVLAVLVLAVGVLVDGILVGGILAGCGQSGRRAPKAGQSAVRVGFIACVPNAAALVGFSGEKHVYDDAVTEASFAPKAFDAGPAIIDALRAGTLDMAFVGPAPVIVAFAKKQDVVVVTGTAQGGCALVAKADMPPTMASLAKRKVAVPQIGNTQDVLVRYQMALNGLRPVEDKGQVTILAVPGPGTLEAIRKGQVDAACVPEPWASELERAASARVLLGSADLFNEGRYPTALLVARKDFADAHPELVRHIAAATDALTADLAKNGIAYAPIMAREIGNAVGRSVEEEDVRRSLKRCRFVSRIEQHDMHVFANLVELAGYKQTVESLDGILWRAPQPTNAPAPASGPAGSG